MLKTLCLFLVLICALPALADKPPKKLLEYVSSTQLVHDKTCNFQSERNVQCLIFVDEPRNVIWLVLFDEKLDITRVVAVKENITTIVWCKNNVCI